MPLALGWPMRAGPRAHYHYRARQAGRAHARLVDLLGHALPAIANALWELSGDADKTGLAPPPRSFVCIIILSRG